MLLMTFTAVSFIVTWLTTPFVLQLITKAGFVRPNFKGQQIPLGVGLVFFISLLLSGTLALGFSVERDSLLLLLLAGTGMTLLGLIDDIMGSVEAKGLKGHFRKLFLDGELTTGALKALMGGVIALISSLIIIPFEFKLNFFGLIVIYTLIIALTTNFMNLLDLRPGRAGKGFILVIIVLIITGFREAELPLVGLVLGSLLAYLPRDLKAQAMMGDTGSNLLGVTLGLYSVWLLNITGHLILLTLLLFLHLITEKYSLTKIIENNRVLSYIDMLGRK